MSEHSPTPFDSLSVENHGEIICDQKEDLFTLKNKQGLIANITNSGGRLLSLMVPDSRGMQINVVAGSLDDFDNSTSAYDGTSNGYDGNCVVKKKVVWDVNQANDSTLELTCILNAINEDFPGHLKVNVRYALTDDNWLKIAYEATVNQIRIANLANKVIFNLNGADSGSIMNHLIQINADCYNPVDNSMIPVCKIESVSGTPFDFRKATTIGARINDNNEQLKNGNGYNHNFLLNKHSPRTPVARIKGDKSGIIMELCTEEPGLHFTSYNFMQDSMEGTEKSRCRAAFALEAQCLDYLPQPPFSATEFNPYGSYRCVSVYRFKTIK
ncbi:MAG TPA: galactose-1-epimerase [Mucilaginibacter sp.]|jgi:aldose 1-epimerase